MPLESATYIDGLDPSNPAQTDLVSAGDDHIRLLKSVLKATFPNIDGPVNANTDEFAHLVGVNDDLQAQLNARPRTSENETIDGDWDFTGALKGNGLPVLRWATANLTSGNVTIQNGGVPDASGTPGSIVLVY